MLAGATKVGTSSFSVTLYSIMEYCFLMTIILIFLWHLFTMPFLINTCAQWNDPLSINILNILCKMLDWKLSRIAIYENQVMFTTIRSDSHFSPTLSVTHIQSSSLLLMPSILTGGGQSLNTALTTILKHFTNHKDVNFIDQWSLFHQDPACTQKSLIQSFIFLSHQIFSVVSWSNCQFGFG